MVSLYGECYLVPSINEAQKEMEERSGICKIASQQSGRGGAVNL
jgi:hypothetical protein